MNIQDLIENVKAKEPLFTALVTQLKPIRDDYSPTLGTDGEVLRYNQKFLDSLTEGEASGTVLHEVLHCAFQHPWRRGKRQRFRWNMAADYAINGIVNETFPLPKGSLIDTKYYGMSAERIYDMLPEQLIDKMMEGDGEGDDQDGQGQGWCEKDGWDKNKGSGKKKGGNSEANKRDRLEEKWRRLFKQNVLKQYGRLPSSMQRMVDTEYYVPVIDWTSLVAHILSEDTNDYSFSVPDRRYLDSDFILPDMASVDRLKDVVFAYDTSGSIEESDLIAFYMETLNLFNNFSSLMGWVAVCDAELHSFQEIQPQMTFPEFNFVGGGGTSFRPVFERINKLGIKPKALFYFTDTAGDFPNETPGYPVYWMVRGGSEGDGYMSNVPFGEVIRFLPRSS